ncbi:cyclic-guanylate-specific phosphodiesterase [Franconibacter pulveris]|uniref:cyclic-guanylate-specific phosphodiesterase n=1 Tax=Franconibacter pulveris TaxID=435910 RepID=UPI000497AF49|nr:cyclic-guanylate-specific phosphodiesterase [Franconibacter pulveris]
MKLKQVTQRLPLPAANIENLQERRFWLQCERAYTYQPIYKTDGRLLAVELLTVVTHPREPDRRIPPDRYFSELPVRQRLMVIDEQLSVLEARADFFQQNQVLASVNIDGPTLLTMREHSELLERANRLEWVRFELVEHIRLPQDSSFASVCELGPLWLDDFGTGMANFSALSEVRYDYIKVARELFTMLRKTPEGQNLFTLLLQLMNRYCEGVIVEGVETEEEWRDVQASPALAAQGYFLSRPVSFDTLERVMLRLS